jgi:hypothetical protein
MVCDEWPKVRADIDAGHPSPIGLITVKSADPFDLKKDRQVLVGGYDLRGTPSPCTCTTRTSLDMTTSCCDSAAPIRPAHRRSPCPCRRDRGGRGAKRQHEPTLLRSPAIEGVSSERRSGRYQDPLPDPNGPLRASHRLVFRAIGPDQARRPLRHVCGEVTVGAADGRRARSTTQTIRPPAFTGDSGLDPVTMEA